MTFKLGEIAIFAPTPSDVDAGRVSPGMLPLIGTSVAVLGILGVGMTTGETVYKVLCCDGDYARVLHSHLRRRPSPPPPSEVTTWAEVQKQTGWKPSTVGV